MKSRDDFHFRGACLAGTVRRALRPLALAASLALCGCGGGGEAGGSGVADAAAAPPAAMVERYPATLQQAGDWRVYEATETVTRPATLPVLTRHVVQELESTGADGSFVLVEAYSNAAPRVRKWGTGANRWTRLTPADDDCVYAPGYPFLPEPGLETGRQVTGGFTQTCTRTTSHWGYSQLVVGRETRTTPAGRFDTVVSVTALALVASGSESVLAATCWSERVTGLVVACDQTLEVKDTATGTIVRAASLQTRLTAFRQGLVTEGPAVLRYVGAWGMDYTGSRSGSCLWNVAASGQVDGRCTQDALSFTASGTVGAQGAVVLTTSTGAMIDGRFASGLQGAGSWVNNGASGSWSATRR